jgi:hypothetical protein
MTVKNDAKERLDDRIRPQYLVRTKVRSNTSEHFTILLTRNDAKEPPLSVTTWTLQSEYGRTFWLLAMEYVRENDVGRQH